MTQPSDDDMWRNRFILLNLTRIVGTIVVLLGLAVWQGDLLREGGAAEIGIPLVIVGLAASFGAPKWFARRWRTPPAP